MPISFRAVLEICVYARQFADKRRVMTNVTHTPQPKEDWQEGYQDGPSAPRANQSAQYAPENRGPVVLPPQVQAQGKPPGETTLNRMYVVEPSPSPTGGMADHRFVLRAGEIEAFAVGSGCGSWREAAQSSGKYKEVAAIARDLQAHRGSCLVVAGDYQPAAVHALAHAMNQALGNVGKTVIYTDSIEGNPVDQRQSLQRAGRRHERRQSRFALILGGNPVYSAPADLNFAAALKKVPFRAYLGLFPDETAIAVQLARSGSALSGILERCSRIRRHRQFRAAADRAALWRQDRASKSSPPWLASPTESRHDLVQEYWQGARIARALRHLLAEVAARRRGGQYRAARHQRHGESCRRRCQPRSAQGMEIMFRPDPTIWDGSWANNGWLQELPKPQNKMTWDNAVVDQPSHCAQKLNLNTEDMAGAEVSGPHAQRRRSGSCPATPTTASPCISGFGTNARRTRGQRSRIQRLSAAHLGGARMAAMAWRFKKPADSHAFATTQHTQTMEGRDLIRVATLEEYKKNPQYVDAREDGKPLPQYLTLVSGLPVSGLQVGHDHRPECLRRLQRLHDGLPGGK